MEVRGGWLRLPQRPAMLLRCAWTLLPTMLLLLLPTHSAFDFEVLPSPCPAGTEYVTLQEARDNVEAICANLTEWMIAEVEQPQAAGLAGSGYQCAISPTSCEPGGQVCGHSVCKRAPAPPPAPRACFSKTPRGENLRLNATATEFAASGPRDGSAKSTATSERFISEVTTGNWAVETFSAVGSCAAPGLPPIECAAPVQRWTKTMYKASSDFNRTFIITGTVSADGGGEVAECYSMPGEAEGAIAIYSLAMTWVFADMTDEDGRQLNCVGQGGVFSVQAGAIQIGFSSSTVYEMAEEYNEGKLLPGMQAPTMIVAQTPTDVPNVPVSVVGVTTTPDSTPVSSDISSFQAMYTGWTEAAPDEPVEYWKVPTECFSDRAPGGWVAGKGLAQALKDSGAEQRLGVRLLLTQQK